MKNAVNKIHIKSEMENRIMARCRTEAYKELPVWRWKNPLVAALYSLIILFSLVALQDYASKNNWLSMAAGSSTAYTETTAIPTDKASEILPILSATPSKIETQSTTHEEIVTKSDQSVTSPSNTQLTENCPSVRSMIRKLGDFIPMTVEELTEYYRRKILPTTLPSDLILQKNDYQGICKRNENTKPYDEMSPVYKEWIKDGDVLFDENSFTYFSSVNDRHLIITVAKDRLPINSEGDPSRYSKIKIDGIDVRIHHFDDTRISNSVMDTALVMVDSVGYKIFANNLTNDEFMSIVTSIIQGG